MLLKFQAWRHPAYRERLKEKNLTGQFIARDEEIGRWFKIEDGREVLIRQRLGQSGFARARVAEDRDPFQSRYSIQYTVTPVTET